MAKKILSLILLISFIIKLLALFSLESINRPMTWEYEIIANNIISGKGISFDFLGTQYRNTAMILYPLICAFIYKLSGHSFFAMKMLQIIISLFTCLFVYKISTHIFNEKAGVIAAALVGFHPGLIVFSVKLHSLTLDTLLFTLLVYLLLLIITEKRVILNSVLLGLLIGLTLLTRATIGLFIPIALISIYLNLKKLHYNREAKAILSVLIGITVILCPLMIRNYLIFHRLVILPNETGYHFWIGNNPSSTGTASTLSGESMFETSTETLRQKLKYSDEFEQKRMFYQEALGFIKHNPGKFGKLFLKKLYYFWFFTPTQGFIYPEFWFMIYRIFYLFALAFFILGIAASFRLSAKGNRAIFYTIILFLLTLSVAQALYYVDGRHRWAAEPIILIFSAFGLEHFYSMLRHQKISYRMRKC